MGTHVFQTLHDGAFILLTFLVFCGLFVGPFGEENLKMYDEIEFKFVNFLNKVINQLPNYKLACSPVFTVLD